MLWRGQKQERVMNATHKAGDQNDPFAQVDLSKTKKTRDFEPSML